MCGVTGLINLSGKVHKENKIDKMTQSISHRGPDSEATWTEEYISLGQTRLSIIDLSENASQPMFSDDKRFVIVFNGEIYNYLDLRKELKNNGVTFFSESDTEVLLKGLIYWGPNFLIRLNGMFTFALWDRQNKYLTIGRDRYGIKPLYIGYQNDYFSFGSEQKAILAGRDNPSEVNKEAVIEYFTFQNLLSEKTLFHNIELFPPGHFATLNMNETHPTLKFSQYWDFKFNEEELPCSEEEYTKELERLLSQAVERQLISDVEVGGYLSGGLDSSSIVATASKFLPDFKTFTIGFDLESTANHEKNFDESAKAKFFADSIGVKNFQHRIHPVDMESSLSPLSWHIEEPRVGQSYPNYFAAKLARSEVKVVLSGIGGDELFGGYPWRYGIDNAPSSIDTFLNNQYNYWNRLATSEELTRILNPIKNSFSSISTRDIFRSKFPQDIYHANSRSELVNASLYFEAKTFLQGLFIIEDKISMAHGLESRVPFMDNDLVDFAMKCPPTLKIAYLDKNDFLPKGLGTFGNKSNFEGTNSGKTILRNATRKIVSQEISSRNKQGFSAPDATWFKDQSRAFVMKNLLNKDAKLYNFLDYYVTESIINNHISGVENRRLLIWSLLSFNAWLDSFDGM
jgi:asparagine synthase (glutamine-hydrolysing)